MPARARTRRRGERTSRPRSAGRLVRRTRRTLEDLTRDVRVGEAVADAAVDLEAPVGDPRLTHLVLEPAPIVGADNRVFGAADHEHAGADVLGIRCPCLGETRVEPDGRPHDAAAGELEGHHPTEAEPHRGQPARVDSGLGDEHVVAGQGELTCGSGILEQLAEPCLCGARADAGIRPPK